MGKLRREEDGKEEKTQEQRGGRMEDGRKEESREEGRRERGDCFITIEYVLLEITIILDFQIENREAQISVSFPNTPGILAPYHRKPVIVLFGKVNY